MGERKKRKKEIVGVIPRMFQPSTRHGENLLAFGIWFEILRYGVYVFQTNNIYYTGTRDRVTKSVLKLIYQIDHSPEMRGH